MTALSASRNVVLFFSGCHRRRLATYYHRRGLEVSLSTHPTVVSLPRLRCSLGLPNRRKRRGLSKGGWVWAEEELGGSYYLESEIYDFMQMSSNPTDFPSKEDLISAGREDLVAAIEKERGWLAYGWNSDEETDVSEHGLEVGFCKKPCESGSVISQHKTASIAGVADVSLEGDSTNHLSSSEDSSSGRLMDTDASDDAGIDGILSRLKKERSLAFGFVPRNKEVIIEKEENLSMMSRGHAPVNVGNGRPISVSLEEGSHNCSRSSNSHHEPSVDVNNDFKPDTWRSWNMQRSGDPLTNFEAAEIVLDKEQIKSEHNFFNHLIKEKEKKNVSEIQLVTGDSSINNCPYDNDQGFLKDEISVHMQHLELQLTSTLQLFKCRTNGAYFSKDEAKESLLKELHKLSDALEFQQNEIKKARDKLRSTRAKLAVIEGKIAMEAIESQKSIEEKQMRLHAAERALCTLRYIWVVWPKSASEVFLTGSFDGWTNQRRMEKKNPKTKFFSLCLKLYPGRYEIKFIVDGVWAVDDLRPVVSNNGFQNNLLVVT